MAFWREPAMPVAPGPEQRMEEQAVAMEEVAMGSARVAVDMAVEAMAVVLRLGVMVARVMAEV